MMIELMKTEKDRRQDKNIRDTCVSNCTSEDTRLRCTLLGRVGVEKLDQYRQREAWHASRIRLVHHEEIAEYGLQACPRLD